MLHFASLPLNDFIPCLIWFAHPSVFIWLPLFHHLSRIHFSPGGDFVRNPFCFSHSLLLRAWHNNPSLSLPIQQRPPKVLDHVVNPVSAGRVGVRAPEKQTENCPGNSLYVWRLVSAHVREKELRGEGSGKLFHLDGKKNLVSCSFVPYFVLLFLASVEPQFGRKRQSLVFNTGVPHGRMFGSLYFMLCGSQI